MIKKNENEDENRMTHSKAIALTFDFELFFKAAGSIEKCLVRPTSEILEILAPQRANCTFFIDTLFVLRLREVDSTAATRVENLIREIVKAGHRVEPHIHSHWVDALYRGSGDWDFSNLTHYRAQTLPPQTLLELFQKSCELLNGLAREGDPNYQVSCFRAGGWCIQPFAPLKDAFIRCGLKNDSSVAPGIQYSGIAHDIDFSSLSSGAPVLFLDDPLKQDSNGKFLEIPISTIRWSLAHGAMFRVSRRLSPQHYRGVGDGQGLSLKRKRSTFFFQKMLSLEDTPTWIYQSLFFQAKRDPLVVISHPKSWNQLAKKNLECILAQNTYRLETLHELGKRYAIF